MNFSRTSSKLLYFYAVASLALLISACQPDSFTTPRQAAATALAAAEKTPTAEPIILSVPTTTAVSANITATRQPSINKNITIWVNETSAAHAEVMQTMSTAFNEQSGINVTVRMVSPRLLPELVNTAVLSGTLPDIVLHPLEYSVGWAGKGILNPAAATEAIQEIGESSFDQNALDLVRINNQIAAIPSDGAHQLWLYRSDWYNEQNLSPPNSLDAMLTATDKLFDSETLITGLVVPTESNLVTTHQVFEHFAIANGCQLIDETGEIKLLQPECQAALDFYFTIINRYSPSGVQTDTSATNAFLEGRTSMIMSSPSILPRLAAQEGLVENTGIVTELMGSNGSPQTFGNLTYLGITTVADNEAAVAFAKYWFEEGYAAWLAVESERKVPMRLGTAENPRQFIDVWGTTAVTSNGRSLQDIFGEATVAQLREGIANTNRWGFQQRQGQLVTQLFEELTFPIVLQEMLSGYFTSEQTLFETYNRIIETIPNYAFPVVQPVEDSEE